MDIIGKKERGRKSEKVKTKEKKMASTNSSNSSQIAKSPLISAKNSLQRIKSPKEHIDHNTNNQTNSTTISNIIMRKINLNGIKKTTQYKPAIKKMIKLSEDSGTKIDFSYHFDTFIR